MTSLLGTDHFRMDSISSQRPSNTPICKNPAIVYPPTQMSSRVEDGMLRLEGYWAFGVSGEDSCSPIKLTVTFDGMETHLEATRIDNFSGIEEPVRLKPSMINGAIASLAEHFNMDDAHPLVLDDICLDPKDLRDGISHRVTSLLDTRFDEPIAPCVRVVTETSVALNERILERT